MGRPRARLTRHCCRTRYVAVAGGTELTAPRSRPFAQAAGGARLKLFAPFRDSQRRAEDIPGFFSKLTPANNLFGTVPVTKEY
jgi:hypothetical protein